MLGSYTGGIPSADSAVRCPMERPLPNPILPSAPAAGFVNERPRKACINLGKQMGGGDFRELKANGTQLANLSIFMEYGCCRPKDGSHLKLPSHALTFTIQRASLRSVSTPAYSSTLGVTTLTSHTDSPGLLGLGWVFHKSWPQGGSREKQRT